jgi:hypothetical protein
MQQTAVCIDRERERERMILSLASEKRYVKLWTECSYFGLWSSCGLLPTWETNLWGLKWARNFVDQFFHNNSDITK